MDTEPKIIERFLKMKTLLKKEYNIELFADKGKIYINDPEVPDSTIACNTLDKVEGYISGIMQ